MLETIRRHASPLVAILAVTLLAASQVTAQEGAGKPGAAPEQAGPAAGVAADTVDGKHAIGPASDPVKRAGKLVAANAQGYLPANIVAKAQNADKLDGLDSAAFARSAALGSADGAVNEADDLVHWEQLKGVPAGFADGQVAWGEVAGKPAKYPDADLLDGLESSAFVWDAELQSYALVGDLGSSEGVVNESDNWVHWNQLKGVPHGFADGVDHEGQGVAGIDVQTVWNEQAASTTKGHADASCGPSGLLVGGGFEQTGTNLRITVSRGKDDTWSVFWYKAEPDPVPGAYPTVTAYAYCLVQYF